jgi:hypothetical protein
LDCHPLIPRLILYAPANGRFHKGAACIILSIDAQAVTCGCQLHPKAVLEADLMEESHDG